jgi:hypothetical protein
MSGQKATRVIVTLTVILTATVTLIRGLHTGDEFIDNLFVDSYFGDGFLAEIINNDYIFPDERKSAPYFLLGKYCQFYNHDIFIITNIYLYPRLYVRTTLV